MFAWLNCNFKQLLGFPSWTKSHGASIDSGSFQLLQVPMIKNPLTSHWIPVGIQFWYTIINIIAQGGSVNEGANK